MREMAVRVENGGWWTVTWREMARIILRAFEKTARARWIDLVNGEQLYCRTKWRDKTTVVLDSLSYLSNNDNE